MATRDSVRRGRGMVLCVVVGQAIVSDLLLVHLSGNSHVLFDVSISAVASVPCLPTAGNPAWRSGRPW
jgi:hypothetical protein